MTRTRWIIFIAICALVLGGLVYMNKKDTVDVSTINETGVIAATDTALGDNVYGKKDAKVVLIEYGDFQCPGCGGAFPQLKTLKETYKDKIAFVFRNFPITSIHPNALAAAAAAEAAGVQGKFWEMHDVLYENQDSWSGTAADERDAVFASYAKQLSLNLDKFKTDLTSKLVTAKISRDKSLGTKVKVQSTPTIFIGNEKLDDESTSALIQGDSSKLAKKLDAALKEAGDSN